jgi:5-hydroxyisourate hydrolase-like protein (transthyretin family)
MKMLFRVSALFAVGCASLFAAIDGTVVNRTTGKPQAGVDVLLVKPGQGGMRTIGQMTTDASGHFSFERDEPGGGPQLLQAKFEGVDYNKLMTPNIPTSNVELDIYQATKSPAVARVAERMLLIEPSVSQTGVSETVIIQNNSNTTYDNESLGSLLFYLPPAAKGQVRVNAQGPQGMPLPRPAEKTKEADIFKVNFPIKPGQTEIDVNYILPTGSPLTFNGRVVNVKGMPAGPLRLIAPSGVMLAGKDIQSVGTEPKTQAGIYTVIAPVAFSVDVTGTGSLHNDNDQTAQGDDSDSPQVTEGQPRIYAHLLWLIALAFCILGVGLVVLYRSSPVRSPYGK